MLKRKNHWKEVFLKGAASAAALNLAVNEKVVFGILLFHLTSNSLYSCYEQQMIAWSD